MKGLEAIKEKILSQAKEKAEEIRIQAQEDSDILLRAARKSEDEYLKKSSVEDESDARALITREESMARSESRKTILRAKQHLIEDVISSAISDLSKLEAPEKERLYTSVLDQKAKNGDRIVFSKLDKEIARKVAEESETQIFIENEYGDFSGGFIIVRDMIEIDLTFDTLADQNKTSLIAQAASVLFES